MIAERPKKRRGPLLWLAGRSRRWWIVVAIMLPLSLPVLYVASFGPACWYTAADVGGSHMTWIRPAAPPTWARLLYWPLGGAIGNHSRPGIPALAGWLDWWAHYGRHRRTIIVIPNDAYGSYHWTDQRDFLEIVEINSRRGVPNR